jgi:hypothetical protein
VRARTRAIAKSFSTRERSTRDLQFLQFKEGLDPVEIPARVDDSSLAGALAPLAQFAASRGCCRKSTALPELAKQLLGKGDQPLVHIALTLKFSCQANFTRAFREATGQTPAQYRRIVGMIGAEPAAKNDNS